jgi:hypothetical protein
MTYDQHTIAIVAKTLEGTEFAQEYEYEKDGLAIMTYPQYTICNNELFRLFHSPRLCLVKINYMKDIYALPSSPKRNSWTILFA